jgi:FkbM family methyltransferase
MGDIYEIIKDKKFKNIIECGGHLGTDTIKLCNLFNEGTVYCIEANKQLYENLKKINNKNLKIFNNALHTKNEPVTFYLDCNENGDNGASSLLKSNDFYLKDHIKCEKQIVVNGITLNKFMSMNNINTVDLLWLDIEGYEYYILESISETLKNIKYIYTEVNFQEFRKKTKMYDDIKKLLANYNFEEINKWEQGDAWGKWQGNVLFRNNNYEFL